MNYDKVKTAFTEITDLWHFILGALCRFLQDLLPIISLIILAIYTVYQATEKESKLESYADYIEFILGYICASIISTF